MILHKKRVPGALRLLKWRNAGVKRSELLSTRQALYQMGNF